MDDDDDGDGDDDDGDDDDVPDPSWKGVMKQYIINMCTRPFMEGGEETIHH